MLTVCDMTSDVQRRGFRIAILQFMDPVMAPPRDGDVTRVAYEAFEPILIVVENHPRWEADTAMLYGTIPSRMLVHELSDGPVRGGFAVPVSVFQVAP